MKLLDNRRSLQVSPLKNGARQQCGQSTTHDGIIQIFSYSPAVYIAVIGTIELHVDVSCSSVSGPILAISNYKTRSEGGGAKSSFTPPPPPHTKKRGGGELGREKF